MTEALTKAAAQLRETALHMRVDVEKLDKAARSKTDKQYYQARSLERRAQAVDDEAKRMEDLASEYSQSNQPGPDAASGELPPAA